MATYVFVAGAWHGSWCWSEVVPLLESRGHRVLTPDLLGTDGGEAASIEDPLAAWSDQIADLLRKEADPVVLVGHSRGGLVISEVAERVPEKVGLSVYLCAFLLQDGQTLQDVAQRAENAAAIAEAMIVHADGSASISAAGIKQLFYSETPDELVDVARARMKPEPLAVLSTPVRVTEQRFGTVPRAYLECLRDQAIPLAAQRAMQAAMPCRVIDQLDSDHSPFFSMPGTLVNALERLQRSI